MYILGKNLCKTPADYGQISARDGGLNFGRGPGRSLGSGYIYTTFYPGYIYTTFYPGYIYTTSYSGVYLYSIRHFTLGYVYTTSYPGVYLHDITVINLRINVAVVSCHPLRPNVNG